MIKKSVIVGYVLSRRSFRAPQSVIPGLQACPGMIEAGGIQWLSIKLWIPAFAGMTNFRNVLYAVVIASIGLLSACGTMPNGRGWGQDATLAPGWDRLGQAAWNAARSPATWGPAAGALALQIDNADRNVVEWAARENPVFSSRKNASRMSDYLLDASGVIWVASMAAAPSGDRLGEWSIAKAKGAGVQTGAGILKRATVGFLKQNTGRSRPDGGQGSFPSAHASGAALYATFAAANGETLGWSRDAVTASNIGLGAVAAATAWARVEANFHYPSDVLGGIAIGRFFGVFFTDAFLGLDNPGNAMVLFEPSREGAVALVRFNF
jgi:membrane-associated phospholipid phosphatase